MLPKFKNFETIKVGSTPARKDLEESTRDAIIEEIDDIHSKKGGDWWAIASKVMKSRGMDADYFNKLSTPKDFSELKNNLIDPKWLGACIGDLDNPAKFLDSGKGGSVNLSTQGDRIAEEEKKIDPTFKSIDVDAERRALGLDPGYAITENPRVRFHQGNPPVLPSVGSGINYSEIPLGPATTCVLDSEIKMERQKNSLPSDVIQAQNQERMRLRDKQEKEDRERREIENNAIDGDMACKALHEAVKDANESIVRWHLMRNQKMTMQDVISLVGSKLSLLLLEAGRQRAGKQKMLTGGSYQREDRMFTKGNIRQIIQAITWAGYGPQGLEGLMFDILPSMERKQTYGVIKALRSEVIARDFRPYQLDPEVIKAKLIADGTSPTSFHIGTATKMDGLIIQGGNVFGKTMAFEEKKIFPQILAETTNTSDLSSMISKLDKFSF